MPDDLAQQILSPVQADNSVKALAWDAFNQSKDANDLAMRLKILGIPNSVKADLWDAKSGNYHLDPTAGLAGVARPNVNMQELSPLDSVVRGKDVPYHPMPGSFEGHPENIGQYPVATVGRAAEGAVDMSRGNVAMGTHKLIQAGGNAIAPMAPILAVGAPLTALRALGGGVVGSKVAGAVANASGSSSDQRSVAEDAGNILGGGAAATGLLRALLGSPTKALLSKAAGLSDLVDPEVTGLVSPRLAHLQRLLINAGKVAGKVQPEAAASSSGPIENEAATSQAAPASASAASSPTLPNATYLQPEMRSLLRPKNAPPSTEINKNTNTNAQEYFIQKMRDQMNRQTVTGSAEQDAAVQRMNDYAKSPFDRATASGPVPSGTQYAYRMRDAGETGIMPNQGKTAQASVDPAKVQSYAPGRATAQNHAQEMVRVDLSKLDPSEYSIQPNGYVKFNGPVPESFIEKMGSKAVDDLQPRVPTSDADLQDLLMKSIQRVKAKARSAKAGD